MWPRPNPRSLQQLLQKVWWDCLPEPVSTGGVTCDSFAHITCDSFLRPSWSRTTRPLCSFSRGSYGTEESWFEGARWLRCGVYPRAHSERSFHTSYLPVVMIICYDESLCCLSMFIYMIPISPLILMLTPGFWFADTTPVIIIYRIFDYHSQPGALCDQQWKPWWFCSDQCQPHHSWNFDWPHC